MSMLVRRRRVAVVWRMEWGLTRFAASAGDCARAFNAFRSTTVWIPNRVIGRPHRLRKRGRDGSPPSHDGGEFRDGSRPQWAEGRRFPPFPLILTLAACRSKRKTFTSAASEALGTGVVEELQQGVVSVALRCLSVRCRQQSVDLRLFEYKRER